MGKFKRQSKIKGGPCILVLLGPYRAPVLADDAGGDRQPDAKAGVLIGYRLFPKIFIKKTADILARDTDALIADTDGQTIAIRNAVDIDTGVGIGILGRIAD